MTSIKEKQYAFDILAVYKEPKGASCAPGRHMYVCTVQYWYHIQIAPLMT